MTLNNKTPEVDNEEIKYEPFSNARIVAFSFSFMILSAMWGLRNKIQLYAEKALGISIPTMLLIMALFVIWDAVNDPLTGYLLDKSSRFTEKYGKRFPFIVIGIIGALLCLILLFVPISKDVVIAAIWILLILCIWDAFQTLFELSSSSLSVDIFRDPKQRVKYGSVSHIISGIGTLLVAAMLPIFLGMFGGATNATAYLMTTIIIVIIFSILAIPYCWSAREPAEMKEFREDLNKRGKSSTSFKEMLVRVFKDRNWIGFIIGYVTWVVVIGCISVGIDFLVIDALGLSITFSALGSISFVIGGFISVPIWMRITKKVGGRKAYFYSLIACAIGCTFFIFVVDLPSLIAMAFIGGMGNAGQGVILNTIYSESIDNATVKSGVREESSYMGIMRFFAATGMFWQVLIFMIVSLCTGYDPIIGTANSDFAKLGLNLQMSIIPAIIILIAAIIFIKMNTITKEDAIENKKKLLEMNI